MQMCVLVYIIQESGPNVDVDIDIIATISISQCRFRYRYTTTTTSLSHADKSADLYTLQPQVAAPAEVPRRHRPSGAPRLAARQREKQGAGAGTGAGPGTGTGTGTGQGNGLMNRPDVAKNPKQTFFTDPNCFDGLAGCGQ